MASLLESALGGPTEKCSTANLRLKIFRDTLAKVTGFSLLMAQTILYESREAGDAVLKTGMEKGVARSCERLAEMLAAIAA